MRLSARRLCSQKAVTGRWSHIPEVSMCLDWEGGTVPAPHTSSSNPPAAPLWPMMHASYFPPASVAPVRLFHGSSISQPCLVLLSVIPATSLSAEALATVSLKNKTRGIALAGLSSVPLSVSLVSMPYLLLQNSMKGHIYPLHSVSMKGIHDPLAS